MLSAYSLVLRRKPCNESYRFHHSRGIALKNAINFQNKMACGTKGVRDSSENPFVLAKERSHTKDCSV